MITHLMRSLTWPGFLLGVGTALVVDRWGRDAVVKVVSAGMGVKNESKAIYNAAKVEAEKIRDEAAHQHAHAHGHSHAHDPATKRTIAQIKAEIAALQREVDSLEHEHPPAKS